jgi:hypothetical protein
VQRTGATGLEPATSGVTGRESDTTAWNDRRRESPERPCLKGSRAVGLTETRARAQTSQNVLASFWRQEAGSGDLSQVRVLHRPFWPDWLCGNRMVKPNGSCDSRWICETVPDRCRIGISPNEATSGEKTG